LRIRAFLLPLVVGWSAIQCAPLAAQSIVSGSLSGTVLRDDGGHLSQALVTLRSLDLGLALEATTDTNGAFSFTFVEPGSYELRVEALGFRPVVASPVTITGGAARNITLSLEPAPARVTTVDTTTLDAGAATLWRPGGIRLGARRIADLPDPLDDLAALGGLSSRNDAALGSEGLPGALSVVVADGVPFPRATHPALRGQALPVAGFSRRAVSALDVFGNPTDIEWGAAAGAFLAPTSRMSTREGGAALEGGWSGDPLWSSSKLAFDAPSLMSFWASGATALEITPDTSRLFLAGEALQYETPLAPRLTPDIAGALVGLGEGMADGLSAPAVQRISRATGAARLDWWMGPSRRFMLRADVGRVKREFGPFGPSGLRYGGGEPEQATDFSLMGGVTSEYGQGLALELRGGISASDRTFGGGSSEVPYTTLTGAGLSFGGPALGTAAAARRIDGHFSPVVHYEVGPGSLKAGAQIRVTQHTLDYAVHEDPTYVFSDAAAANADRGAMIRSGEAPESSFSTTELSLFGQYAWDAAPGLRVTVGGRFDYEVLPGSEATINSDWMIASGLRNDEYPSKLSQFGAVASVVWDVAGDGRTLVEGTASQVNGDMDPWILHEVFSSDTGFDVTRFAGAGIGWPGNSLPVGAHTTPSLSLLGPDSKAPRSTRAGVGMTRRLSGGWALHADGVFRRTDFLPRRRDLNLAPLPLGTDANGRDVFGDLEKLGSVAVATPGTNRRFPEFDQVWAIDTDGWSEYRGVSVGIERVGGGADFFATYTRSETRDNWVGAATGLPDAQLDPTVPDTPTWSEGVSDFDVPDRLVAGTTLHLGPSGVLGLSAVYRYESGLPFTAAYRLGVDANGDGSWRNDVAWVPSASEIAGLLSEWPCLDAQAGAFAVRNGCRGPARHALDARARVRLGRIGGRGVEIVVDGYGLVENEDGIRDTALLLVDPGQAIGSSAGGTTVTLPVTVNPDFGKVLVPTGRGRILRVGIRIGGGS